MLAEKQLAEAAALLADEVGLENLTVPALARRLGIKEPNLYPRAKNAQELRVRVALLAFAELADLVAAAMAGRSGKDALMAFANAYRSYAKQHPGRYAAMQIDLDPAVATASAAPRHAAMTRAILHGYQLAEPDQTDAVRLLHSTFHGFTTLEAADRFAHSPRDTDASWSRTLDALDIVLRNWPR
ncbi:WHG domain-containing protein [Nonomuraea sp. NPDC050556]|uniref:TetR/AcrR family transcriptional regulator n=1 Tax=Nonomuraea sp. NPDC050556 TaxID=3364369 RepID=UPI0037AD9907